MGLHALWRVSVSRATPAEAPPTFSNSFIGIQVGDLRASEPYSCLFTQLFANCSLFLSMYHIYEHVCANILTCTHMYTYTHI